MAVNAPSIEAVTEFTVDTNGFKAEYGQASGGIMSFASKSGTNDLHGIGLRFHPQRRVRRQQLLQQRPRHRACRLQAARFRRFRRRAGVDSEDLQRQEQTFFFFSYEAFRNRDGPNGFARTVPTAEMYDGDFRNWVNPQRRR